MSSSTGVRKRRTPEDRIDEAIDGVGDAYLRKARRYSDKAFSQGGALGTGPIYGSINPGTASLPTSGGAMIGSIAFNPILVGVVDGRINIEPGQNEASKASSYVLVTGEGTPDDLRFIDGADKNGQYLILQATLSQILVLKAATLSIIATISGLGTVTVVTTSDHNMLTGDKANILDTDNFDISDVTVTKIDATTFTYSATGSIFPETTGTVQNGNIVTPDGNDVTLDATISPNGIPVATLIFDPTVVGFGAWRLVSVSVSTGGAGTGLFISADLTANQTANLTVNDHVEFDRNTTPTGADGGIVLQTGAGQLDGIFELIANKTYFMTAAINPIFTTANNVEFVWFDITNGTELGRRVQLTNTSLTMNQPKCEIIFTPTTNVNVEVRIVGISSPAALVEYDAAFTFASIFEFSGVNQGGDGDIITTWKLPVRAKSTENIPILSSSTVIFDGVTLVEGDRVLLTDQSNLPENGLYQVGVVSAEEAPLTRPADFDTSDEVLSETFVAIEEGTQFKNELYHLITNNPITIDVSNQLWEEFAPGTSGGPDLGGGADGIDGAGQFVNDGRVATSRHITKRWELITAGLGNLPDNGVNALIWIPPLGTEFGRIVAVGSSNAAHNSGFSDDLGVTWSQGAGTISSNKNYVGLAYDFNGRVPTSSEGVLVAIANSSGSPAQTVVYQRSIDRGDNFSNVSPPNGDFHEDIIWADVDSQFVATSNTVPVGTGQTRGIQTSPDGSTWTVRTTPVPANTLAFWKFVSYSSGQARYVALTGNNTDVMVSDDAGVTWTLKVANITLNLVTKLIYSPGQNKFVAVGRLSSTEMVAYTSVDGETWEQFTIDTFSSGLTVVNSIVWSPELSMYVAVGITTATGFSGVIAFWVSNDAKTWTRIKRPVENVSLQNLEDIISAEEYGQFVATSGTTTEQILRTFR